MAVPVQRPALIVADRWRDYQLIDCGAGMKQERWGPYTLVRPDPQVLWPSPAPLADWDGLYHRSDQGGGRWEFRRELPEHWEIRYEALQLTFKIRDLLQAHGTLSRAGGQLGLVFFPDPRRPRGRRPVSVLNLFGYTGAATCAAAAAGAEVCHVDAAEGMVKWCRENAALSGLAEAPIRYIADDCLKFVRREKKRGRRYDAVIMDPPTYRRGSTGEMWRLEDSLWELLEECRDLLTDLPLFFLINAYTARLSPTVVANLLAELLGGRGGAITAGEVGLPIARDGKVLPCGIYGRWEAAGS